MQTTSQPKAQEPDRTTEDTTAWNAALRTAGIARRSIFAGVTGTCGVALLLAAGYLGATSAGDNESYAKGSLTTLGLNVLGLALLLAAPYAPATRSLWIQTTGLGFIIAAGGTAAYGLSPGG